MKKEIRFTALFVKNTKELLKKFPPKHEKIFGDHSTIEFNPKNLKWIEVGKESSIKILFEKALFFNTIEYFANEEVQVIEGYSDGENKFIKDII